MPAAYGAVQHGGPERLLPVEMHPLHHRTPGHSSRSPKMAVGQKFG